MILCEICGNEFAYGKAIEKQNDAMVVKCPYCNRPNMVKYRKRNNNGRGQKKEK